jgi:hypothetical protein
VTAAGPEPPAPELLGNCGWCPVCQAADALRSENPEALAKIIAAAGAFLEALRDLIAPTPTPTPTPTPGPILDPAASKHRVQRIVVDSDGIG